MSWDPGHRETRPFGGSLVATSVKLIMFAESGGLVRRTNEELTVFSVCLALVPVSTVGDFRV